MQALQAAQKAESQIKPPQYHGKLGVIERIGDVVGQTFAPGLEANLGVGTEGYERRLAQAEQATDRAEKENTEEVAAQKALQPTNEFEAWRQQNPDAPVTDFLTAQANAKPKTPEDQVFGYLIKPKDQGGAGLDPAAAFQQIYSTQHRPSLQSVTVAGPDGKPIKATFNPQTGETRDSQGNVISNPLAYVAPHVETPEAQFIAEYVKDHPGATLTDAIKAYSDVTARPSFPRVEPVNDANGNTLGYNYLEGTTGGGVAIHFLPANAGGAPTVNSGGTQVIPAKPTASTLGMIQQSRMTLPEAERLGNEINAAEQFIGPGEGRWQEMMTGKIGTDNPQVAALMQDLQLYATAVGRAHFGARTPEGLVQQLFNDFRLSQSPDDLRARIASANNWLGGYAAGRGLSPNAGRDGSQTRQIRLSSGKTVTAHVQNGKWVDENGNPIQ